jgi:hypothetical protein
MIRRIEFTYGALKISDCVFAGDAYVDMAVLPLSTCILACPNRVYSSTPIRLNV